MIRTQCDLEMDYVEIDDLLNQPINFQHVPVYIVRKPYSAPIEECQAQLSVPEPLGSCTNTHGNQTEESPFLQPVPRTV